MDASQNSIKYLIDFRLIKESTMWLCKKTNINADLDRMYLQPHYNNGVLRQCLPFSWTTLRGKHCRHPIAVMGVVDTFGPDAVIKSK
jgi:hypothetical protein